MDNPADSVFCAHGAGYNVKWERGQGPRPRGQRPAPGGGAAPAGGGRPRPAPQRVLRRLPGAGQGAPGHLRAHLRQGGAGRLPPPAQARPHQPGRPEVLHPGPEAGAGIPAGGRLQPHLRLGGAEGGGPGQPGRRPADAHGGAQQLPGLQAEYRHSGVRRLQGAPQRPGRDEVPQHLRGLHQGGRDGGHLH